MALRLAPDGSFDWSGLTGAAVIDTAEHTPVVHSPISRAAKRAYDLVVATLALVVALPVMFLVALAVKATSPGPVLFTHTRIGRGGRRFPCLKFRTMHEDAQARLQELLQDPARAREWQENHKLKDDPRITPIGGFLRRTSLDELPQFLNVLVGHMSVVGPRPIVDEELDRYDAAAPHYLSIRPGITGPWQVNGRSDTTFEERVEMDREYAEAPSVTTDVRLTAATVKVMLHRVGAY